MKDNEITIKRLCYGEQIVWWCSIKYIKHTFFQRTYIKPHVNILYALEVRYFL